MAFLQNDIRKFDVAIALLQFSMSGSSLIRFDVEGLAGSTGCNFILRWEEDNFRGFPASFIAFIIKVLPRCT